MRAIAIHREAAVEVSRSGQAPVPYVGRRCALGHGAEGAGKQLPVFLGGVWGLHQPAAEFDRPPDVVGFERRRCLCPDSIGAAEPGDELDGAVDRLDGEQLRRVTVEEPEQAGSDLAHMVFGDAVELARKRIVVAVVGQTDRVADRRAGRASVRVTHGLVPEELDRVAGSGHSSSDVVGAAERRPVGAHQVLGAE